MSYVPRRLTPILLYHHLGSIERRSRSYLEPTLFEKQLAYCAESGFGVVDLGGLVEDMRGGRAISEKSVSITFDDGWYDSYTRAFPVLQRRGISATIFLVSGRIGLDGYLGWKEIREMREGGIRFGAHSVSHPRLTEISLAEARSEIGDCKKALEDGLGEEIPLFCYPYGFFNRTVRDFVEEAGYRGACCNSPGRLWSDKDVFALKRVTMTYRMDSRFMLAASLSGYYVFLKELRAGNKGYIMLNPPTAPRLRRAGKSTPPHGGANLKEQ
jgi:peptidoglycan/xylan/chitin deacetylase (PgdA/CDA1 family)